MAVDSQPPAGVAPQRQQEVTFGVTGMTCASCVRRIEKTLSKVDGVAEARVNLATEKATVVYDPEPASLDAMKAAVEKAGYGVRQMPEVSPTLVAAIPAPEAPGGEVILPLEGMTCASCVRRIEKVLSRVPGVTEATVNLATEKARVVFDPRAAGIEQFTAAVETAG